MHENKLLGQLAKGRCERERRRDGGSCAMKIEEERGEKRSREGEKRKEWNGVLLKQVTVCFLREAS